MNANRPVFVYSMVPRQTTTYKKFFESEELRLLIERPGQLRPSGWDLLTHNRAKIVKGDYIEVKSAERKKLQIYEDGSLIVRVPGDQEFMGWGVNVDVFNQMPRLNTLALIEFSFNFCNLCSRLLEFMTPEPSEVELSVEIKDAFFGDNAKLFLIPHPVSSEWWAFSDDRHYAPEAASRRKLQVSSSQLRSHPNVVTFLLLRQIFLWFGVQPDKIPYSARQGDLSFIDATKIINSRA